MRRSLHSLSLILLVGVSIWGQDIRPSELTDEVVEQVVDRILRYEIKPARRPRTVYVYGTSYLVLDEEPSSSELPIQREWLPRIKNIEFRVYGENDPPDAVGYYFSEIEKANGRFQIGVGYGNLGVGGGEGKVWSFRIKRDKVRLWLLPNTNFGWATCEAY